MLTLLFATSIIIFLCFLWLRFSLNIIDSLKGVQGLSNLSAYELSSIVLMVAIPVILLLLILIFIYLMDLFIKNKSLNERITITNTKIHSALEVMSRRMMESLKMSYSAEFFKLYPIIMDDLSDTLTDIITKSGTTSELVISSEMEKYGNNRLIATCRIILLMKEKNINFDENFKNALKNNESLLASVEHFKKSYDKLLEATINYDHNKFLYSSLETGIVGKVYLILTKLIGSSKE